MGIVETHSIEVNTLQLMYREPKLPIFESPSTGHLLNNSFIITNYSEYTVKFKYTYIITKRNMTLTYKGITTNYNELSKRSIKTINFLYQTINTKYITPLQSSA